MANETDTGLMGQTRTAEALVALAARPFDPAALLTAPPAPRRPLPGAEALPYATGPTPDALPTFDPAALLGDAARRGPAMIGDGKPLLARIGGVEVVTIPLEHYAALVRPLALARGGAESIPQLDAEGMFGLLMKKADEGWQSITLDDVRAATGLGEAAFGERVAAWKAAQPWIVDTVDTDGTMRGKTPEGVPFTIGPALSAAEVAAIDLAPTSEPAPLTIAPTPEKATVDFGLPAGMPEETTIAIPAEPLDTRTTLPAPEKRNVTTYRRREKHEHRGGPMNEKGQPDNRETDIHDTMPHGRRDRLDLA